MYPYNEYGVFLTLWSLLSILLVAHGAIGQDGLCPLYIFVPFTFDGVAYGGNPSSTGISHLAAALLAMEHFNDRNESVVPELRQLKECNVQFDTNKSVAFDSGVLGHKASRSLFGIGSVPCAIAGPFSDQPALELSTMAQAAQYPLVSHYGLNMQVTSDSFNPFTSQTVPDLMDFTHVVVDFLTFKERTNFISVLYVQSDTGVQRRETLGVLFDSEEISWESYPYAEPTGNLKASHVRPAMKAMKARGFRTIVVCMEVPLDEFPAIADAAEEFGMSNGDYFWIWFGLFDFTHLESENPNMTKLASGSAWIFPMPTHYFHPQTDPFLNSWSSQGPDFVDRLNAVNPIDKGEPGYQFVGPDYMRVTFPDYGSEYLYDAVMSIGIGACMADRVNKEVTGEAHLRGIRNATFIGATGKVEFLNDPFDDRAGARRRSNVYWGAFNLLPPRPEGEPLNVLQLSDALEPGATQWTSYFPFIYADGRDVPPDLLRDMPKQNYLSPGLRAFGFALMAIGMFLAVVSVVWVYINRKHRVLRAAQPYFLYLLAFGSFVSVSTIITISFDESYGLSDTQLSMLCMATPWLLSLGHILIYGALFSKLWRVNRVLQFVRRQIDIKQVAWPVLILVLAALLVLSLWSGLDSLEWERKIIDDDTYESMGKCESEHIAAFTSALVVVMVIPTVLTGYMAFKTKDVDDAFSESWWIFTLIVIHMEVIFIAVPVYVILQDVSTNGRYIGLVFVFWTFPMSTLLLIMVPKVIARRAARIEVGEPLHKRGERIAAVHVTGVSSNVTVTPTQSKEKANNITMLEATPEGMCRVDR